MSATGDTGTPRFKISSLRPDRLRNGPHEMAFLHEWQKENVRRPGVNYGFRALELILHCGGWGRYPHDGPTNFHLVTQRDADVATAVIQWLGTNCGRCFLEMAEKRGERYAKRYWKKQNKKLCPARTKNHTNCPNCVDGK